ncbi:MAG: hypothetical protein HGA44_20565 [Cellulomonadaceae bacterium]|nr:hypothetical protein [Cellulomonadaceae bacterium]
MAVLAGFVAIPAVLAGCAEPGYPSFGLALARSADGQLTLLGTTCSGSLSTIELGSGLDWWADAETTITPTAETSGEFHVDLPEVGAQFEVSPVPSAEPVAPMFVRVTSSDGVRVQAFEELPAPGDALFILPGEDAPVVHDLGDFQVAGYCDA